MSPNLQGRVSITITLATAIGLLVFITAGSVLGVGIWLAQKNTFSLLSQNADTAISAAVTQIEQHLKPAEHQARFVAEMLGRGEIDPDDRVHLGAVLTGALAAAPQVQAIMYIDRDLTSFAAGRKEGVSDVQLNTFDYSKDPVIQGAMAAIDSRASWGPPVYREPWEQTYLNLAHPVAVGGRPAGAIVAVVTVEQLSRFVSAMGADQEGEPFILYGRDHVIAHSRLADGYAGRVSVASPLPTLQTNGDPILARIWQTEDRYDLTRFVLPENTEGHVVQFDDDEFIYMFRRLEGYGPESLLVGAYFRGSNTGEEVQRMIYALIAGIAALVLSLIAAVVVGNRIARPIVQFSEASGRIRDLEISEVKNLPGSIFRELNEQSRAFNAMLGALRWFELYVPRKVVERLVKRGAATEALSDARDVTVMFTDIVGFSSVSEDMAPADVAAFVNAHFSAIVDCVEAEDGTVDKFIGDSVMAFWGAPDEQPDAAARACRSARAIAARVRADNAERIARGEAPVRMRIGIHSGTVTVGNIGAPGRLNYTIIGDSVNIGQRLEQLGKELGEADADVVVLMSGDTAAGLGDAFTLAAAGRYHVKGRVGEVEVFRLEV